MRRLVIVGAGLAGLRAAQAARKAGFEGDLVIVGDEPYAPYTRPPLSKEFLVGDQSVEQGALMNGPLDVELRLGTPATSLDPTRKLVQFAEGEDIPYDRLILATGCRARLWPSVDPTGAGLLTLRNLNDALALRAALEQPGRLLIIGAGFVGCEVAASARKLGAEVTLVDIAPHPLLPLGAELGARCALLHRERGVDVRCATGVERLRRKGSAWNATLSDGTSVAAETVLVAMGALPNTEWLVGSDLQLDPGVVCDATLTTIGDPDILAAGDIVSWPHPLGGGKLMRVEHWTVAGEHGQLAGQNALLEPRERAAHTAPPFFWSDQYETKVQALGFPALAERLEILEQSPDGERLVVAGSRDGRLIGVVAFNAIRRMMFYRRQLFDPPEFEQLREHLRDDDGSLGPPNGRAMS